MKIRKGFVSNSSSSSFIMSIPKEVLDSGELYITHPIYDEYKVNIIDLIANQKEGISRTLEEFKENYLPDIDSSESDEKSTRSSRDKRLLKEAIDIYSNNGVVIFGSFSDYAKGEEGFVNYNGKELEDAIKEENPDIEVNVLWKYLRGV